MSRRAPRTDPARKRPDAVGVDTGGTFTDFVARVGRAIVTWKEPSTPAAPQRAVLAGLDRLGAGTSTAVRHGSTVATNALLERKGARVTLVTTAGFEDVLEIGRQDRPDIYALVPRRVPSLVPRSARIGVRERLGPGGRVRTPLTRAELARVVRAVRRTRPESIAVGLLHAFANPRHERMLARALVGLGVPITTSAALCPEIREVERLATTTANAYLMPRVAGYLSALRRRQRRGLEIVLSHGGTAPVAVAAREPVRQLLSGPAAGLEAAFAVARACGFRRALTLDVGGTSTDCAFADGDLPRRRAREVAGIPIQLPMLDVHTVGAGGGSIAHMDAAGLLAVGPYSAGAHPGPAAYGGGGPATVTDAMVVLGRLPAMSLGARVSLERAAALRAMTDLARPLRLGTPQRAAQAVVLVADAHMEAALRRVSVERGYDPRDAALVAFGGAGGLHACALSESLGCAAVLFPANAGVLSALGALIGGERHETSRSVLLDAGEDRALARVVAGLTREVLRRFAPAARSRVRIEVWAEARYAGQAHELSVRGGGAWAERFHAAHQQHYGFMDRSRRVQIVTLDVRGALPGERLPARGRVARGGRTDPPARVWHAGAGRRAHVLRDDALGRGAFVRGPAIVLQSGATLWVPPRWTGRMHASGTLVLSRGAAR